MQLSLSICHEGRLASFLLTVRDELMEVPSDLMLRWCRRRRWCFEWVLSGLSQMVDEQLLAFNRFLCLLLFLILLLFGIRIRLRLAGPGSRIVFLIGIRVLLFCLIGLCIVIVVASSLLSIARVCRRVVEHGCVVRHLVREHSLKGNLRSLVTGVLRVELLR